MYTYKITNGIIVDGTGAKPYRGAVYFDGDKIAAVTADETLPAEKTFDAQGHVIAPGFIDVHSHSDSVYRSLPTMTSKLLAGVTCEFIGQCGGSCVPRGDEKLWTEKQTPIDVTTYAEDVRNRGCSINLGVFIGHGTLRSIVMGAGMEKPTPEQLQQMCDLLEKMLIQGATGVSFGLIYAPGCFADEDEITALAKVCAKYDRVLAVHMRNENYRILEAIDEMLRVAERSGVRLEISHLKVMGNPANIPAEEVLAKIDNARARGIRVTADQYPYTASHSGVTSCLPKWALDGGMPKLLERLRDEDEWAKIKATNLPALNERGGAEHIVLSDVFNGSPLIPHLGKSLAQISEEWGLSGAETIRKLLLDNGGGVQCFYKSISEDGMMKFLARRDISVVSDGSAFDSNDTNHIPPKGGFKIPHPRNSSFTVRFFRLVRENNIMPIEEAVRKLTGHPAEVMGFADRFGTLKAGLDATVTVFDPETVADRATFTEPALKPVGIDGVFVNGELVLDHGTFTSARPGRVVRK